MSATYLDLNKPRLEPLLYGLVSGHMLVDALVIVFWMKAMFAVGVGCAMV
jgi:hypothetical protein